MSTIIISTLFAVGAEPLLVLPPSVDRGEVKAGAALSQTFRLKNSDATPVSIIEVGGSCGCARPHVSKKELQPGESAELRVDVNTLAVGAGTHAWKVTVRLEHGPPGRRAGGECEAVVRAKVVREIEVEPVAVFLSIDREASHTITVTDRRPKPLTVTGARCDSKHVKTEVGAKNDGRAGQTVRVTVLDSCPPGHSAEQVIVTTDDPDYELRVPLLVARKAPGQVLATPEQIDLRLAQGQKSASGLVRLRDPEGKPVVVERIEADHPGIRTKWAAGPGAAATVRLGVELADNRLAGLGSVKITVKEPKAQVLIVPVSWQAP